MSTPNNLLFNKFLKLIDDRDIAVSLSDEDMTEIMDAYRSEVSSLRFKICKKNLLDIEAPDFYTQTFTTDGIGKTYVLDRYPISPNSQAISYVCILDDIDISTYTFDATTKTFTLNSVPEVGQSLVCGYNFVGQYNDDLDDQEQWIIARGMILSWISHIVYSEKKLKNSLTTKDYKTFSSSEVLRQLTTLKNETKTELRDLIVSYSFDSFTGFN
jgi:hypothetical protein